MVIYDPKSLLETDLRSTPKSLLPWSSWIYSKEGLSITVHKGRDWFLAIKQVYFPFQAVQQLLAGQQKDFLMCSIFWKPYIQWQDHHYWLDLFSLWGPTDSAVTAILFLNRAVGFAPITDTGLSCTVETFLQEFTLVGSICCLIVVITSLRL